MGSSSTATPSGYRERQLYGIHTRQGFVTRETSKKDETRLLSAIVSTGK